ncbi:maestro heat-like repeat-containing protein family member 1 [Pelobates fuscus]|uniref:maestro heat-like repeat-containing protein family member 1 n=1 Tax=Pelobates fuscus TaxID=191477 RepID=UPI002FE431C9
MAAKASKYPDLLLSFLLPKLETSNPKLRVGTLLILKQVINSATSYMESKKPLIVAAVKQPLQDGNNKVRRAMVQLISAMAHHGYLEQAGGEVLLEYLIRLCCTSPELTVRRQNSEPDDVTEENVRRISISTLYLISTTVDRMTNILWPYLLEFLVPIQFTNAVTPLCKSLVQLGQKKQEEGVEMFLINYNLNGNIPPPHALFARLLVVAAVVELGDGRSSAALSLLNVMQINIHPTVGQCWSQEIPALLQCLEEAAEKPLQQIEWEDKLLKFLVATLQSVEDDAWKCQLSIDMNKQLPNYNVFSTEKNFLYRCIGTTLGMCVNRDMVRKQLQDLLATARYQEETDREGLAAAFGICSVHHLDDTLEKMSEFLKSDIMKKNLGIFNIFKDRSDGDLEKIKSALILCYGYVAIYAPTELVLPRIESDILRNIFLYFHTKVLGIKVESKDLTLRLCLIRSISMVGLAICNSSQAGFFNFSRKVDLITQLMEFIKSEPADTMKTALRHRCLVACTYLIKLEPPLSDANKSELINTSLTSIFSLPPVGTGGAGDLLKETLYKDTLMALKDLLRSLLVWNLTPSGLQEMFQIMSPWIKSSKEHERERALDVSADLLDCYLHKLNVNCVVPFHNLGALIGSLATRCADSLTSIRQRTVDCIYYLLYIQLRYEGFALDYKDELVEKLQTFRCGLQNPDSGVLFHTCFNIAVIIGKRLPPEQITSLLFITFEGLSDPDTNCSRAATVMVNSLLKERGSILLSKVPEIIVRVHDQLQDSQEEHVKKAAIQTVYILATQHVEAVVSSLLSSQVPYDSETCILWRALSSDPPLTSQVLTLLLEKLCADVPYKESKTSLLSSVSGRVATLLPLSAACALQEVLSVPESAPAVMEHYSQLFTALLLRISSMVGVHLPKNLGGSKDRKNSSQRSLDPCSSAVEALKYMLIQGGCEEVSLSVEAEGGWENMKKEDSHHVGISSLSSSMVQYATPKLPAIIKCLQPIQSAVYDCQRITATAFLAEVLRHSDLNDFIVLESLMDSMTSRLRDNCVMVRMLAVRGLGNIACGSPDKVKKYGSQLLTSMINSMDDREDPEHVVTQEAMSSLSLLLPHVQDRDIHSLLIHTAIRIRPFFDHEREELRSASVVLFGNLSKFSSGEGEEVFFEQILNSLVVLLLHLQDPKPEVVKACKVALQMCAAKMKSQSLAEMFQSHLQPSRSLHYGEFMNNACKHLLQGYPDILSQLIQTNITYFKSIWPEVRAAAPMFIGFLVLHMQSDQTKLVDLDHLVTCLIVLLKDPVPSVRVKASETMARLVKIV